MKEKSLLVEKIRKSALVIILSLIGAASITLTIGYYIFRGSGTKFFIFAAVTALAIEGIYSAVIYKKGTSNESRRVKSLLVYRIIWNYTILVCFMVIWYKISFSKPVIQNNSYWIYNLMVFYIIISFAIKYINNFLRERKRLIEEEKAGATSIILTALATAWVILYLNFFVCYWLYIPKKTMDFTNAPRPSSLYTYGYKFNELHSFAHCYKEMNIEDDNLLDSFINELSNTKIENIRGVEYLRYDVMWRKQPYYMIYPSYKDANGSDIERPYVFDKMYFRTMRLYKNGELILENYRSNRSILSYFYTTELYKVNLSQELTNQIIDLFENNSQVKDSPSLIIH